MSQLGAELYSLASDRGERQSIDLRPKDVLSVRVYPFSENQNGIMTAKAE
jgi:hypothetical protein